MNDSKVQPKNLDEWLVYLESLHPKTIALGLDRVAAVKQRLNLNSEFPIIIVGGTNGKGSVCAMLEAVLHAAGYQVACYTSPHLLVYNERVRIAKQQVSDQELCDSFAQIEQVRGDVALTYFEFATLAAMKCFVDRKVEVAILEVGLGGRLDAVNIFDGDCAVVTSIDIDHADYLGDTREKIAFEKAGIFRTGKVAIFGDLDMPSAIVTEANRVGAELRCLGRDFGYEAKELQWNYHGISRRNSLPYPALRGAFQLNNAASVLAVLDELAEKLPVSMAAVRRGLTEVELAGRFQCLPGKPALILDVAHNPHAARSLAKNLASMPPCPKTYAVLGMLKDKDMAGVLSELIGQVDVWLLAGLDVPRGASIEELTFVAKQQQGMGEVSSFSSVTAALHHACKVADENDRIIVLGSFYTVAEAMRAKFA